MHSQFLSACIYGHCERGVFMVHVPNIFNEIHGQNPIYKQLVRWMQL